MHYNYVTCIFTRNELSTWQFSICMMHIRAVNNGSGNNNYVASYPQIWRTYPAGTSLSRNKSPTSWDKSQQGKLPTSWDKSPTSREKSPNSWDKSPTSREKSPNSWDKSQHGQVTYQLGQVTYQQGQVTY